MDRIVDLTALTTVVQREVAGYASASFNSTLYTVADPEKQIYAVVGVLKPPTRSFVVVLARVVNEQVLILADNTDHPLFEALMQSGIPRDHIILAYAGETPAV